MRRMLFSILAFLALGLWVGGLAMLFISVSSLFQTYDDRTVAGLGATGIFKTFEVYQLILAVVAIVATALSLHAGRTRTVALTLLVVSLLAAVVITFAISPRIDAMRIAGQTTGDTFHRLHGLAMVTYLAVAHLVAAALVTVTVGRRPGTDAIASRGPGFQVAPADSAPAR